MHITAKGRYAFAALIEIAQQTKHGKAVSVTSIAEKFGVSEIFLEQALAALKKNAIIHSKRGAKSEYQLMRETHLITAFDVLSATERILIEKANSTISKKSPITESAMKLMVFDKLDKAIEASLSEITIRDILEYIKQQNIELPLMFYI